MRNIFILAMILVIMSPFALGKTSHLLPTSRVMDEIFVPMSRLLPMVFNQDQFESADKRQEILSLLETLDSRSKLLEKHSRDKQAGFKYMSESLANDLKDALRWYKNRRYREARFILRHVTENCIACHSKLPAKSDYPGGKEFIKKVDMASLSKLEKARLELSTRQFEDALKSYEDVFEDTKIRPAKWVTFDALTSYLKLAIGVKGDLDRPVKTFEKLLKARKDIPEYMQKQLSMWITSLTTIKQKELGKSVTLASAKELVRLGEEVQNYPADRSGLVYSIQASSILERLVGEKLLKKPSEIAEAYYNLGLVEMSIGRSFWVSQVDNYLEMAVRQDAGSSVALKAYNLLEENIFYEFTGSSGTQIPFDKQQLLDELTSLIKAATKKAG